MHMESSVAMLTWVYARQCSDLGQCSLGGDWGHLWADKIPVAGQQGWGCIKDTWGGMVAVSTLRSVLVSRSR